MSDLLNTPGGGLDESVRVGKTYFRELRQEWKQLRAQRDAITAEAGRLREALEYAKALFAAEVGAIKHAQRQAVERAQSAEAQVAALREALGGIINGEPIDADPVHRRIKYVEFQVDRTELEECLELLSQTAATASRYRARVRVEVLRQAAKTIREDAALNAAYHALRLESMADAAEREAQR